LAMCEEQQQIPGIAPHLCYYTIYQAGWFIEAGSARPIQHRCVEHSHYAGTSSSDSRREGNKSVR
jgi:hypothetical protein